MKLPFSTEEGTIGGFAVYLLGLLVVVGLATAFFKALDLITSL